MLPLKHGLSTLRTCSRHRIVPTYSSQIQYTSSRFVAQRWYAADSNTAETSRASSATSSPSKPAQPQKNLHELIEEASESALQAQAQAFNPDTNLPLSADGENTAAGATKGNSFMPSDSADSKVLENLKVSTSTSQTRRPGRARPAPAPPVGGSTSTPSTQSNPKDRRAAYKLFSKNKTAEPEDGKSIVNEGTLRYKLYVLAKRQNCIMTLKDEKEGTVYWASGGRVGFKGVGEGTYEAGYQCAVKIFERLRVRIAECAKESKTIELEILLRGFGQGRSALLKALTLPEGDGVREVVYCITDRTQIKIGGVRLQKARRL